MTRLPSLQRNSLKDSNALALARIDHGTATHFFQMYEHLGDCGLGVWHWGAFLDSRLIAVVSFGTTCFGNLRGPLSRIAEDFELNIYQISRGGTVPSAPLNTASRVVSSALLEFARFRGECLVVAYADRLFNEIGTIYQACNAIYTGLTQPKDQSNYKIHGRKMSGWVIRKKFGTRAMDKLRAIDANVVKIPLSSKYRYVFVQASPTKRKHVIQALLPLTKPYPKRQVENIQPMDISALIKCRVPYRSNSIGAHNIKE